VALPGVDLVAFGMAFAFVALAAARRERAGDRNSIRA
jgi:hypothetical protein